MPKDAGDALEVKMTTTSESEAALIFTDAAAAKVKQLIEEEGNDALMLRVFISGGGCSGFQYGFTFDENINEGDTKVENDGVRFVLLRHLQAVAAVCSEQAFISLLVAGLD